MIRLSRKAWNNVIIFAMLLMILLFNTTTNILTGSLDEDEQVQLLPAGSVLMTLQMPDVTIERIGQGWRTSKPSAFSEAQMHAVASQWQSSFMATYDGELPADMPMVVVAWLAGESSGRVFQLHGSGADTFVLYQQQVFHMLDVPIEQLILLGDQ